MLDVDKRTVKMLDLGPQHAGIWNELIAAIESVLASQQFIMGPEVKQLEQEIADYCSSKYGIACASGSDALLLALMGAGIGRGDEVITTPFTFFATAGSIVRLGARPVFVDIDASTFNMDESQAESVATERTKAVMPVHLFGQCCEMESLLRLGRDRGLAIIEDAAQSIGAEYKGKRAGNIGTMGAFSFYPTKNLGGAGDGGMLTTSSEELAGKLRILRSHGAKEKYFHDVVGINSRLDTLQAAMLRVKMKRLDGWAGERRQNAARYIEYFGESGLVSGGWVELPIEAPGRKHVYNQFVIRAKRRDGLRAFLKERGVGTEIYYPVPMHMQPCFADLGYKKGQFPISERTAEEALALPVYPGLDDGDQAYIVDMIRSFYL